MTDLKTLALDCAAHARFHGRPMPHVSEWTATDKSDVEGMATAIEAKLREQLDVAAVRPDHAEVARELAEAAKAAQARWGSSIRLKPSELMKMFNAAFEPILRKHYGDAPPQEPERTWKLDFITELPRGYRLSHKIPVHIYSDGTASWEAGDCHTSFDDDEDAKELLASLIVDMYKINESRNLSDFLQTQRHVMRAFIIPPAPPHPVAMEAVVERLADFAEQCICGLHGARSEAWYDAIAAELAPVETLLRDGKSYAECWAQIKREDLAKSDAMFRDANEQEIADAEAFISQIDTILGGQHGKVQ